MTETVSVFKQGEKAAMISAFILLAVTVLKGAISLVSGSVALQADSVHSFADIFSSIAVWAGLRIVQKKPNERFTYGYYKAETLALLIVAITVAVSGILILTEAIGKLFQPGAVQFPSLVLMAAGLSGIASFFLGRYKTRIGKSIGSQSLVGEGQHSLVDVYTSLLVFAGVSFSALGYPTAEVLAGILIGLYIIKVGLWFGKDAILVLMDACLSPERAREIKEIAEGVQGVIGVHDIRLRKSGPVIFGEMHVELLEGLPLDKVHAISDEVEKKVRQRFKDIESITIHAEPAHKEKFKVAIPVTEDRGLESNASIHFAEALFFVFVEMESGRIENVYVKPNRATQLSRKKGIEAARFLVDEKTDILLVGSVGEGPFHMLRDNMVQMYVMPERVEIKEAIRLLNENGLERVTAPLKESETDHV